MSCFSSLGSPPYFCFLSTVLVITGLVAAVRSHLRGFPDDSVVKNLPVNRHRGQTYGHGERGGEGEMYVESDMETYNTICKIESQWEFAV